MDHLSCAGRARAAAPIEQTHGITSRGVPSPALRGLATAKLPSPRSHLGHPLQPFVGSVIGVKAWRPVARTSVFQCRRHPLAGTPRVVDRVKLGVKSCIKAIVTSPAWLAITSCRDACKARAVAPILRGKIAGSSAMRGNRLLFQEQTHFRSDLALLGLRSILARIDKLRMRELLFKHLPLVPTIGCVRRQGIRQCGNGLIEQ